MRYVINILIILILLTILNLEADDNVNLFIPADSIALGESYIVSSRNANGVWLNPAGLIYPEVGQYSISGIRWSGDINLITGSAVLPFSFGNLGVGVGWFGKGDVNFEDSTGTITDQMLKFNNLFVSLGYSRILFNIPFGVNLKFQKLSLGLEEASSLFFDIGIMYKIAKIDIGLMLRNFEIIGSNELNWGEPRFNLGYHVLSKRKIGLYITGDTMYSADYGLNFGVGMELKLFQLISLRGGFTPDKYNKFQFGTGIVFNIKQSQMKLDYGMNPALEGLDTSHFIQLTLAPGQTGFTEELKEKRRVEAHIKQADLYMKLKNYDKAKEELNNAINLDPQNKEAYNNLGKVYYYKRDYKLALENARTALSIDNGYEEARELEEMIYSKVQKDKPAWLKEGYFYSSKRLNFADFEKETIVSKFIADTGDFEVIQKDNRKYGKWTIDHDSENNILKSAIRLPDMSKFDGIVMSMKSDTLSRCDLVLVEQTIEKKRLWYIPLKIKKTWQELNMPFRYFKCDKYPRAKLDLSKIIEINFVIREDMKEYEDDGLLPGNLHIDNIIFYK